MSLRFPPPESRTPSACATAPRMAFSSADRPSTVTVAAVVRTAPGWPRASPRRRRENRRLRHRRARPHGWRLSESTRTTLPEPRKTAPMTGGRRTQRHHPGVADLPPARSAVRPPRQPGPSAPRSRRLGPRSPPSAPSRSALPPAPSGRAPHADRWRTPRRRPAHARASHGRRTARRVLANERFASSTAVTNRADGDDSRRASIAVSVAVGTTVTAANPSMSCAASGASNSTAWKPFARSSSRIEVWL